MATFNDPDVLKTLLARVGRSADVLGLSLGELSKAAGVSPAFYGLVSRVRGLWRPPGWFNFAEKRELSSLFWRMR
jgi:hypothetical protein